MASYYSVKDPRYFLGIEVRTNNKDEFSGSGKIPSHWETFLKSAIGNDLKDKLSQDIVVIYSGYESDHTGNYDYFLGYEVSYNSQKENKHLAQKTIEPAKYTVISSQRGPVQNVAQAWQKIWAMEPSELGGTRLYRTDFEIYSAKETDFNNMIVNIYLGVKD